jgi:glycosyltransferase involved in cell wall biosynthesis
MRSYYSEMNQKAKSKNCEVQKVALLTGGKDRPYNLGLLEGLVLQGLKVDFIANDDMQDAAIINNSLVNYFNLRGDQESNVLLFEKITRVLKYYWRLIWYAARSDSKIFHIQWFNKFEYFDRTILNIYYKLLGKKLIYTAHNINMGKRDGNNTQLNIVTLKLLYKIVDHIIVHTRKMKKDLECEFDVDCDKISVLPFGINNTIPMTDLNRRQARDIIGLCESTKVILFFGNIAPYKGLEYLLLALADLKTDFKDIKLIIAGRVKECPEYWAQISKIIIDNELHDVIIQKIEFIPDKDIEIYFKASDALLLPYKFIYQSGPLFLGYNFGLPVIATDVGSFREDIEVGKTGLLCRPDDPGDLAQNIRIYFKSELYKNLEKNRQKIVSLANQKYSWSQIGKSTLNLYKKILNS